jgi:hypothetical protein
MCGIVDEVLALGHRLNGLTIFGENGSKVGHLSFETIPSQLPFLLALPQSETERILSEHLQRKNVEIERRTTTDLLRTIRTRGERRDLPSPRAAVEPLRSGVDPPREKRARPTDD